MSALFEHSPWVEERADARPSTGDRHADLMAVVHDATPEEQLALIRAHPELAGKAPSKAHAVRRRAGAGTIGCRPVRRFQALNAAYGKNSASPSSSACA